MKRRLRVLLIRFLPLSRYRRDWNMRPLRPLAGLRTAASMFDVAKPWVLATFAIVLVTGGCGQQEETHSDSPPAVLVERATLSTTDEQQPELLAERRYSGELSQTPIGYVSTALLGTDTLVYVLDPQNQVIHVAKGAAQVRLLSRAGSGPGDMQRPSRMAFLGDSIALPDESLARVTIFALRGRAVRTVQVTAASAPGFYGVEPVAYGPTSLLMSGWNVPGSAPSQGSSGDVALFLRRHGATALVPLSRLTRGDIRMNVPTLLRGQPVNMPRDQPFALSPAWDFGRQGGGVAVLDTTGYTTSTITLRLRQWNNEGRLVRTCTLVRPLQPLTNAAYEAGLLTVGPPPMARDIVKPDWAAVRQLVVRPRFLPPFRGVRLASDGSVWIRTEASFLKRNEEYLVLSSVGCAPRSVQLPHDTTVEDARGRLFITSGFVNGAPVVDTWRY